MSQTWQSEFLYININDCYDKAASILAELYYIPLHLLKIEMLVIIGNKIITGCNFLRGLQLSKADDVFCFWWSKYPTLAVDIWRPAVSITRWAWNVCGIVGEL